MPSGGRGCLPLDPDKGHLITQKKSRLSSQFRVVNLVYLEVFPTLNRVVSKSASNPYEI